MFSLFKKKEEESNVVCLDTDIVAITDAKMVPLEEVNDEVFANKMMGDGIAFEIKNNTICSPCNGSLDVVFPTGHAFGITMKNGVGLMIHIGINTVDTNGDGFSILVKQGQEVKAGTPLVKVDVDKLKAKYDMTTMLIVTDSADQNVEFIECCDVTKGQKINR